MQTCSICYNGYPIESNIVVNAVFRRISTVKDMVLTPLQLNCHHIFHYSCISQTFHEQIRNKYKPLSCPTCHLTINFGIDNAPWGVYFTSNFESKIYLKKEEIIDWTEEKVEGFYIGGDYFLNVNGIHEAID